MRKAVWSGVATAAFILCFAPIALAQTTLASGSIGVTANVNARAKLTLGVPNIVWTDEDPDLVPAYTSDVSVEVKARTAAGTSLLLTLQAGSTFASGADTIPFANFTWTSAGAGFIGGPSTVSLAAQQVWAGTGSQNVTGTQTLRLVNSWSYAPGTYSVTLNYTLSAP